MGQRSVFVRKRDSAEDEFAYERGKSYRIRATFPPQNVIFLPMDENYRLEVTNRFEPSWVPPGLEDGFSPTNELWVADGNGMLGDHTGTEPHVTFTVTGE